LIALVVVCGLLAVGLIIAGVALFGRGGAGDAGGREPLANCTPGATCLATDLPDPGHVDAQAILPTVTKMARNTETRAVLSTIFVAETGKDGAADITGDKQILYQFSYPAGTLSITLRKKMAIVMKTQPLPYSKNTPEPQCSLKAAFKAAGAAGFVPASPPAAMYGSNDVSPGGVWTLTAGKQSIILDGKTCAVKMFNKL